MRLTDETIASLCIKYLAWDEPVSKRDIELVRPMFEKVAELTRKEIVGLARDIINDQDNLIEFLDAIEALKQGS